MRGLRCWHLFVSGRVQGVAFRWSTQARAEELGLAGWVRNRRDGRVEVWIEGEEGAVARMREWLRAGPPGARVTNVEALEGEPQDLYEFEIKPTG